MCLGVAGKFSLSPKFWKMTDTHLSVFGEIKIKTEINKGPR